MSGTVKFASGRKLEYDTADRSQIIAVKLGAQSDKQLDLIRVEGLTVGIVVIPNLDASTIAAMDSFDWVRTSERRNVTPDCHFGNIELVRQIVVCIVPSQAQHFQQSLAAFG